MLFSNACILSGEYPAESKEPKEEGDNDETISGELKGAVGEEHPSPAAADVAARSERAISGWLIV